MGAGEIRKNLQWFGSGLRYIGRVADAPTVWQRLTPEQQARRMNELREVLVVQHDDDWPDMPRPEIFQRIEREGRNLQIYDLRHEHATPSTELHHWHQQVQAVVDADTPLHRGQLLTWDLDNPTDYYTRSPRAVPATVANTLLKRNYDLLICLNNTSEEDGPPDHDHYAITSRDGLFATVAGTARGLRV